MRKTLVVVALTAALSGGTAVTAYADTAPASGTVAEQTAAADTQTTSSDKTGLWGLLGLLGLAGLIKRRETAHSTPGTRR